MSWICNECTKRNCHKEPKPIPKRAGRFGCAHFMPVRGGFSFLSLILESSPKETLEILHAVGLQVTETKRGFQVKPKGGYNGRKQRHQQYGKRRRSNGGRSRYEKQNTSSAKRTTERRDQEASGRKSKSTGGK